MAACNPHRGNSLASLKQGDWIRGTYYVRSLHPTLDFLKWDYGSLDEGQERDYIKAKMMMVEKTKSKFQVANWHLRNCMDCQLLLIMCSQISGLVDIIVNSQRMMRKFASEQLQSLQVEEVRVLSRSCVSQRDIQRVFSFYQWFRSMYKQLRPHGERADYEFRPLLVSLGLVYYMRLSTDFRRRYSESLDENCRKSKKMPFSKAFLEELDYYVERVELPKGIARTLALKENLFAIIICTINHIPLIIVGAPGSSKTLSFNQAIANLKGLESKKDLFRNTEFFRSLDPHHYQCSRLTTSTEIQTVFSRAINRQHSHRKANLPTYCVVFMDEAGLPEESHESLKVLHYHLDQPEVSFVAITNHVLDAAKTNRAISLYRPEASDEDLKTLARGCFCSDPEHPPSDHDVEMVEKFCLPYSECMKSSSDFSKFFGLRDFIHFVSYLRRKRLKNPWSKELVLNALERNFNGFKDFEAIVEKFLQAYGAPDEASPEPRLMLEVLEESLTDRPQAVENLTENEVRYKLLVDPSEDDSLVRLIFSFKVLKRENTRVFVCSDFPGDGQLQKINTIAAIRHSAIQGHTVVMSQTDDIHESFYDLFNQRFRRIDDPEKGPRYYTNIAIGAHSRPSRVHPEFQCVVVVKESDLDLTPAPFLNRFEKYTISYSSLLEKILNSLPPNMANLIKNAKTKVSLNNY